MRGRADEEGLEELWDEIRKSKQFAHLRTPGIKLVPGIGSSRPLAMVVGEAPGATENARGEPFCGASGRVLAQLMELAGMYAREDRGCEDICHPSEGGCCGDYKEPKEANVWLTNVVKFRPPGNRTPNTGEILSAREFLRREWKLIGRPKLIVCVGSVAANAIRAHPISMQRGVLHEVQGGNYICYQYHPAYGLRNPSAQPMMERHWEQLGEQIREMGKELQWS